MTTLKGYEAIKYAEAKDLELSSYANEVDGPDGRNGLTPDEARKIAAEDPSLIYVTLECIGWTDGDGSGYNVDFYFVDGSYLGPDEYGIEPIMTVAQ